MTTKGNLRVGMSFGTVGGVLNRLESDAKKRNEKVSTKSFKQFFKDGSHTEYFRYEAGKSKNSLTYRYDSIPYRFTTYTAEIDNVGYSGWTESRNIKGLNDIYDQKFTKMTSADNSQYAEDLNGNGVIDKGEIFSTKRK